MGKKTENNVQGRELFQESWESYHHRIINSDVEKSIDQRLLVLSETHKWFLKYGQFKNFVSDQRAAVAGFYSRPINGVDADWVWFGSMKGAGHFKRTVNENNEYLSLALDAIPMDGHVTREHFDSFMENFLRSRDYSNPIAIATRLLCIKRPDYFICINNGNRNILSKLFRTRKSINLEDYWNSIILKIIDTPWWNSGPPKSGKELAIYQARTALLDIICYEEDSPSTENASSSVFPESIFESGSDVNDNMNRHPSMQEVSIIPPRYPSVKDDIEHHEDKNKVRPVDLPVVDTPAADKIEFIDRIKQVDIDTCRYCRKNLFAAVKYCPYCRGVMDQSDISPEKNDSCQTAEKIEPVPPQSDQVHTEVDDVDVSSDCDNAPKKRSGAWGFIKKIFN